jgi:hypothetical protein
MTGMPHGKRVMKVQMDRILESAVVLSWKDLLHISQEGLIHIEYVPGPSLQYLKIWQLTGKGSWSLICEYWMSQGQAAKPVAGLTFSNDYHSEGLAEMLNVIMQHQGSFMTSIARAGAGCVSSFLCKRPRFGFGFGMGSQGKGQLPFRCIIHVLAVTVFTPRSFPGTACAPATRS